MKINVFLFSLLLSCCFYSCSTDPCDEDMNSLECPTGDTDRDGVSNEDDSDPSDPCIPSTDPLVCPTGDFDMDGVLNSDDPNPSDPCVPSAPAFEVNVIGTWDYSFFGSTGRVKINEDGTYEDLINEIVSSGPITSRMWSVENNELRFAVQNASLQTGWISYDCDSFVLDGQGLPNITFTRV